MNGNSLKATGRSSSQRSIKDYPEHLNPFYEDEHHKRLRFWKIGNDKASRSNSFSIDGLKGLWSFKTFKLKKKTSSLGVNRTSESPPMLRRDNDRYGNQTTFDGRMRHTVDIGLGNNFQRGAQCRSSLQDLTPSQNQGEIFLARNNRFRSTIQPGISSVSQQTTPVFRSRYKQPSISRGSSQTSINSTNPFEDEYETISVTGSLGKSSIRQSGRKKRRAPPPPVSPNKEDNSEDIAEDLGVKGDLVSITNLTAEIESFVHTADTDRESIKIDQGSIYPQKIERIESKTSRQSPENNDYYTQDQFDEITMEKIQNLGTPRSPVKILIRAPTDEESSLEEESESELIEECEKKVGCSGTEDHFVPSSSNNTGRTGSELQTNAKLELQSEVLKGNEEKPKSQESVEETTPTSSAVEFILENQNHEEDLNVLKITESNDDLTNIESNDRSQTKKVFNTFEVQTIPLKLDSPKLRRKVTDDSTKNIPPTPPQRRRSVKEIIESINKCQSLLKINQRNKVVKETFTIEGLPRDRLSNVSNSFENDYRYKEIAEVNNNTKQEGSNIPVVVEKFNKFNNNVEWNPVPKPRRHKITIKN